MPLCASNDILIFKMHVLPKHSCFKTAFLTFRYGLTIPKQGNSITSKLGKSASIFQDDSSEEDEVRLDYDQISDLPLVQSMPRKVLETV